MSLIYEERLSDSPYIELVTQGRTVGSSTTIRPAECHWHMIVVRHEGGIMPVMTGPLRTSGEVRFNEGVEMLWIKFKLGTFMPHMPTKNLLDTETPLPTATSRSFWLKGSAWQLPSYENVETFIERLVRDDILVRDPVVAAALNDEPQDIPDRTMRHRFLRATGLTQTYIRQMQRAQRAAALLEQGVPILDTVYEAGYFDQPHLTRSLKRFIGKTPAQQLVRVCEPE